MKQSFKNDSNVTKIVYNFMGNSVYAKPGQTISGGTMIETILTAIARKILFMGLLFGAYRVIDIFYFKAFDTDVELKGNPNAIAIMLGLFAIALAFA